MVSGEGLVNVYRGTGEVWLTPTQNVYKDLKMGRSIQMNKSSVEQDQDI